MLKNVVVSVLFILGVSFAAGYSSLLYGSDPQEGVKAIDDLPSFLSLVGQKCTVFLNNGTGKYGTLWEIGEDFIIIKIKKGPLYSKEEKFAFSEIDYLEDTNGKKFQLTKFKEPDPENENLKDTKKEEEYIPLETVLDKLDENGGEQKDKQFAGAKSDTPNDRPKSKQDSSLNSDKKDKTATTKPGLVIVSRKSKKPPKAVGNGTKPLNAEKKTSNKAKVKSNGKSTALAKSETTTSKSQQQSKVSKEGVEAVPPESKNLRILKYQTVILFSVAILAFTLMFLLKVKEIKGYNYGANCLIPTRLTQTNGEYGVIDQGSDDGVKVDDIIRFYSKQGRHNYKGKVKVIRVTDNYSAVKLVKNAGKESLSVGDVGFRYRSLALIAAKAMLKAIGKSCSRLAKGFERAAKNLNAKTEEPNIEVNLIERNLESDAQETKTEEETKRDRDHFSDAEEAMTDLRYIDDTQTTNLTEQNSHEKIDLDTNFAKNEPETEVSVFDDLVSPDEKEDEGENIYNKPIETNENLAFDIEKPVPNVEFGEKKEKSEEGKTGHLKAVEVVQVSPNPFQPRETFDPSALEELKQTISKKGIIQPISVRKIDSGYELIAGERRLRAVRELGLERIPAYVLDVDSDEEMLELSLIENLQRENLNPIDEANGYQTLISKCNLTQEEIAQKVGKDRATIANFLRLLKLPNTIQKSLIRGEISAGHARALLALPYASDQISIWKIIIQRKYSVRQVEEMVKNLTKGAKSKEESPQEHKSILS